MNEKEDEEIALESLLEHLRRHPELIERLELPDDVSLNVKAALLEARSSESGLDRALLDQIWDRLRRDAPAVTPAIGEEGQLGPS